jgi:hypothetical protein
MQRLDIKVIVATTTSFAMLAYLVCAAFQPIFPDWPMYALARWQALLPGFTWTINGVVLGLIEIGAYAAVGSVAYAWLYNTFTDRLGSSPRPV